MEKPGVYLVHRISGKTWSLEPTRPVVIGRGIDSQEVAKEDAILVPDPLVSKLHARVGMDPHDQHWYVQDLSKHGTYVNGRRVDKRCPLKHGDQLTIGSFALVFYENFAADDGTLEIEQEQTNPAEEQISSGDLLALSIFLAIVAVFCFCWVRFFL